MYYYLGFVKKIKFWLEFFLYLNLKKNNGHWGLSIAYMLQELIAQEWALLMEVLTYVKG